MLQPEAKAAKQQRQAAMACHSTPTSQDSGAIGTIYDLACGHGLLGVLLAYRFDKLRVVCVDLEKRAGFYAIVSAFEKGGDKAKATEVLPNLSFVEGDIKDVDLEPNSFVACVHGCNEVSSTTVERAQTAGCAGWAMPCCIRDALYCVKRTTHVEDEQRYATMVGVLAGTYGGNLIAGIDRRITNRNLCVFGGWERGLYDEGCVQKPTGEVTGHNEVH